MSVRAWLEEAARLRSAGRFAEAAAACRRAIEAMPGAAEAHHALCNTLRDAGELDGAIEAGKRTTELAPHVPAAWGALGVALLEAGRLGEAEACLRRALALNPGYALASFNLAEVLLLGGAWREGWARYEARWAIPGGPRMRPLGKPMWDGKDLGGQRVLLHAEAGLGDTIMCARYVPMVAARGGKVIVECAAGLRGLLRSVAGVGKVVAKGEVLPAFEAHAPLLSLPWLLGTTVENVPSAERYLSVDDERAARWRERMTGDTGLRVGLAWAGSGTNPNDWRRSVPPGELAALAAVEGVTFYSLQKWRAPGSRAPEKIRLVDWTADLHDFSDTAGLMANLDLVIAVDSSPAHLAGAMGVRAWMLTAHAPDPRWMLGREDTVWYRSMRLFRQQRPGDWGAVVANVAGALAEEGRRVGDGGRGQRQ